MLIVFQIYTSVPLNWLRLSRFLFFRALRQEVPGTTRGIKDSAEGDLPFDTNDGRAAEKAELDIS